MYALVTAGGEIRTMMGGTWIKTHLTASLPQILHPRLGRKFSPRSSQEVFRGRVARGRVQNEDLSSHCDSKAVHAQRALVHQRFPHIPLCRHPSMILGSPHTTTLASASRPRKLDMEFCFPFLDPVEPLYHNVHVGTHDVHSNPDDPTPVTCMRNDCLPPTYP